MMHCRLLPSLFDVAWGLVRRSVLAVHLAQGSTGSTAQAALAYIEYVRPKVVLLENVVGLSHGARTVHMVTLEQMKNVLSNLFALMDKLMSWGYICLASRADSAPRMAARWVRAWVPCVHAPELDPASEEYRQLEQERGQLVAFAETIGSADDFPFPPPHTHTWHAVLKSWEFI